MERYADRMQSGIAASDSFAVAPFAHQQDRQGWRWHFDRLLRYAVNAGRLPGDVFHIVDHGFAHLSRWLPADRTVVTCHDLMALRSIMGHTGSSSRAITVQRFRWSVGHMRNVAHVACDSEATRDDLVNLVGVRPERTSIVPLGVDRNFRVLDHDARLRVRRELGLGDAVVVGNVSTGAEYKNPAGALRTLRHLHDGGIPAVMLRTGRGFSDHHRQLQHELGLDPFVIERGIVTEEELVETYNASDVLLHPSYWEGFGWPPLEAMSCGTPVVTSCAPSLLEITAGCGLSAEADDHAALAACVRMALEPSRRDDLRTRGLVRADQLRWEQTIDRMLAVYQGVLANATSPSGGLLRHHRSARRTAPAI